MWEYKWKQTNMMHVLEGKHHRRPLRPRSVGGQFQHMHTASMQIYKMFMYALTHSSLFNEQEHKTTGTTTQTLTSWWQKQSYYTRAGAIIILSQPQKDPKWWWLTISSSQIHRKPARSKLCFNRVPLLHELALLFLGHWDPKKNATCTTGLPIGCQLCRTVIAGCGCLPPHRITGDTKASAKAMARVYQFTKYSAVVLSVKAMERKMTNISYCSLVEREVEKPREVGDIWGPPSAWRQLAKLDTGLIPCLGSLACNLPQARSKFWPRLQLHDKPSLTSEVGQGKFLCAT